MAAGVSELIDKAKVSASVLREITEISAQGITRSLLSNANPSTLSFREMVRPD